MNTLIELYDERAIENILAPDMFRPRRIVYLCPGEIAQDRTRQETLAAFFRRRGWEPELIFVETSLFKADRILRQLFTIGERFPDCACSRQGCSRRKRACPRSPIPGRRTAFTTFPARPLPTSCPVA